MSDDTNPRIDFSTATAADIVQLAHIRIHAGLDPAMDYHDNEAWYVAGLKLGGPLFRAYAESVPPYMMRDVAETLLYRPGECASVIAEAWERINVAFEHWRKNRVAGLEQLRDEIGKDEDAISEAIIQMFTVLPDKGLSPFSSTEVAKVFGMTQAEVRDIIFPREVYLTCSEPDCREILEVMANTMAEYKELISKETLNGKSLVCNTCWEERYRAQFEEQERQKVQREAERSAQWQAREREQELLRTMPYRDYLQTDHWKTTRAAALKRAGHKCQLCNSDLLLQVHHRNYANRGSERASDLIVLCRRCHDQFHNEFKTARR